MKSYLHHDELHKLAVAVQKTLEIGRKSILKLRLMTKNNDFKVFNGVIERRVKGMSLVLSSNNKNSSKNQSSVYNVSERYVHKANRLVQYINSDNGDNLKFKVYESLVNDNGIKSSKTHVDFNALLMKVITENIEFINKNDLDVVFGDIPKVNANSVELERIVRSLVYITQRNSLLKPELVISSIVREDSVVLKFNHVTRFIGHIGDFVDLESVSEIKNCYKSALKMNGKFWFSSNPKGENCFYLKLPN